MALGRCASLGIQGFMNSWSWRRCEDVWTAGAMDSRTVKPGESLSTHCHGAGPLEAPGGALGWAWGDGREPVEWGRENIIYDSLIQVRVLGANVN